MPGTDSLYSQFNINREYDSPDSYGPQESWYGDGKYPPDWKNRREAIWDQQRYLCGRCGRYKGDVDAAVCHHVRHLANGGSNQLNNLVGLCGDCHSVMHPDNPEVSGAVGNAPVFPDSDADDRVAVVHTYGVGPELEFDLRRLGETEMAEKNVRAITTVCEPIPAEQAKVLSSDGIELAEALKQRGLVARSQPHNRLYISTGLAGMKGVLSPATPVVESATTAEVSEVGDSDRDNYDTVIYTSPERSQVNVNVSCKENTKASQNVELAPRERVKGYQATVEPPDLTLGNVPHYLWGIMKHLGAKSLVTLPIVFLLTLLSVNPLGASTSVILIGGLVLSELWLGLELLFSYGSEPTEDVVADVDRD